MGIISQGSIDLIMRQVAAFVCSLLLAVAVCQEAITPVELGDQDLVDDSSQSRVVLRESQGVHSEAGAPQNAGYVPDGGQTKAEKLEEKLKQQKKILGDLVPSIARMMHEKQAHEHSVAEGNTEIKHLKFEIEAQMNRLATTISKATPEISDPAERAEAEEDQRSVAQKTAAAAEKQVQKTAKLGTALKQAENMGVLEPGTAGGDIEKKSSIGLTKEQREHVPYLSSLDESIQAALTNPVAKEIKSATKALSTAADMFAQEEKVKQQQAQKRTDDKRKVAEAKAVAITKKKNEVDKASLMAAALVASQREAIQRSFAKAALKKEKYQKKNSGAHEAMAKAELKAAGMMRFTSQFQKKTYNFVKMKVMSTLSAENLVTTCASRMMFPVCDSYDAFDGRCRPVIDGDKNWHLTVVKEAAAHGIPLIKVARAWFYSGPLRDGWAQSVGYGSPTTAGMSSEGYAYCVNWYKVKQKSFTFKNIAGVRILVSGQMSNANIEKACKVVGMKPLCDSFKVTDGRCTQVRGVGGYKLIMSDPKTMKVVTRFAASEFTYFYGHDDKSTLNYRVGGRRTTAGDRDGFTLCGVETEPGTNTLVAHGSKDLFRKTIVGPVTSASMLKACNDTKPVCNSFAAWDGSCALLSPSDRPWEFANPHNAKEGGIDESALAGTYMYAGFNLSTAAYNTGCCGPRHGVKATGGRIFCVKDANTSKPVSISYDNYELKRVSIKGISNPRTAIDACRSHNATVVCDTGFVFFKQGVCIPFEPLSVSGGWQFSDLNADISRNMDRHFFAGAVTYNGGRQGHETPLNFITDEMPFALNPQKTYMNMDIICAKRELKFSKKFSQFVFNRHKVIRVRVLELPDTPLWGNQSRGQATSSSLLTTCANHMSINRTKTTPAKYAPICDSMSDNDGMCVLLGDLEVRPDMKMPKDWYMSRIADILKRQIDANFIMHTSFYTGLEQMSQSRFVHRGGVTLSDYGLDTFCTAVPKPQDISLDAKSFPEAKKNLDGTLPRFPVLIDGEVKTHEFKAVRVNGTMEGINAITACAKFGTGWFPVCDNFQFAHPNPTKTMTCYPISHPQISALYSVFSAKKVFFIDRILGVTGKKINDKTMFDVDNVFWYTGQGPMMFSSGQRSKKAK